VTGARSAKLHRSAPKLAAISAIARSDSRRVVGWSRAATDSLAMSESLLPMAGHAAYRELSDEQRWRLALLEATHFFSLNIDGERELTAGLAQRLADGRLAPLANYLEHFLREEHEHTAVFTRFCLDYGGGIFPMRQFRFERPLVAGEGEFVFFARVLVFEEIAQFYNQRMAVDPAIWRVSREINRYHAEDEARHIAFGRLLVEDLWERLSPSWSPEDRQRIGRYVARYTTTVLNSYVSPDVHRAAGLAAGIRREILDSPHWASLTAQSTARVKRWLAKIGVTGNV
jgi:hypothetical protein